MKEREIVSKKIQEKRQENMQEKKEQELQQKYMQFQMVDSQVKQLKEQIQALNNQMQELQTLKQGLKDLESVEEGSEALIPLNAGVYLRGEVKDKKKVVINVGSNVMVDKDVESAKKMVESQIKELLEVRVNVTNNFNAMVEKARKLQREIMSMQE